MIARENISVVVQGPIQGKPDDLQENRKTQHCLESIRRVLPSAEIVLSTWKGSDGRGLSYDVLVESDDPGGFINNEGRVNNVNRQIISTRAGLLKATRDYIVKLRTDTELINDGFIQYFSRFPDRADDFRLFHNRLVGCEFFFKNPREIPLLFHIGDIFLFGERRDLLDLWDIPLAPAEETTCWEKHREKPFLLLWDFLYLRYLPEQYIWTAFLRKKGFDISLDYPWELSETKFLQSELSIVNNFVILPTDKLGISLPGRLYRNGYTHYTYSFDDWTRIYQDTCCGAISDSYREEAHLAVIRAMKQLRAEYLQRLAFGGILKLKGLLVAPFARLIR